MIRSDTASDPVAESPTSELSISSIISTVGRDHLRPSLESVLNQNLDGIDHEVIVVNDSGAPLPARFLPAENRIRITNTGSGYSGPGAVRNMGAVLARGMYLHFFDDDDLMLPNAFQSFRRALHAHPEAEWIHGCVHRHSRQGEYLDDLPTTIGGNVLTPLLSGEWFPLQASLVRADTFRAAGGFDTSYPTSEDMHLMMRLALTIDLVRVPDYLLQYSLGPEESACLRSEDVEYLLKAHEVIFDQPETFNRAIASADSIYWRAQLVRNYLISVKRNARAGAYGKLGLRLLQAGHVVARSGLDGLRPVFWRSLLAPYRGYDHAKQFPAT